MDPDGTQPVISAVQWLQGTLLGTVATTAAVIAVASMGMMLLTGRVDLRRGASIVIGCFILFGASSVVAGFRSYAIASDQFAPVPMISPPAVESISLRTSIDAANRSPTITDPYAGASVPPR
jgi:type IV secretory pathway VirB2 component (pilin)